MARSDLTNKRRLPVKSRTVDSAALRAIVGDEHVRVDDEARNTYGRDGTRYAGVADAVVFPETTAEVARIARWCDDTQTPIVPRGAGTGYSGGAVPVDGGIVVSLERMNRILTIDERSLFAVVQPHVVTGEFQDAVERVGLFYPPDPASLWQSVIGGNVAESAGGPRTFKYGTTKHYVLGLEAVLPTGEVIRTGGRVVKNVVGYDLTQLLVGSEGTLAILTEITLRLIPKPPAQATIRATFASVAAAADAVDRLIAARVIPCAIEIVDGDCLAAVARYLADGSTLAPAGTAALLLIEVDGLAELVAAELARVEIACAEAGATSILRARDAAERRELWRVRRELSPALKTIAPIKYNNDVVVPKGRVPELFALVAALKAQFQVAIPSFGHAGDGNIHVNIMVGESAEEQRRAEAAQLALFQGVVALRGSLSGEHGIGLAKANYLGLELTPETIALMQRVKAAFDPHGILNPGKIFPRTLS
jgi:glycolate oxidase